MNGEHGNTCANKLSQQHLQLTKHNNLYTQNIINIINMHQYDSLFSGN